MSTQEVPVNNTILQWAREFAGLSVEEVAHRAKIKASSKGNGQASQTAADRLLAWEKGLEKPTITQLNAIAKVYRWPLVTFFMPAPPIQEQIFADFRTVTNSPKDSPEFAALKRRIILLHRELLAIATEENAEALPFVGSANAKDGISVITQSIQKALGLGAGWQDRQANLFKYLRDKIHDIGIFVVLMGDLGSHHSRIAVEEFRGLAIADSHVPLIVINSNDADSAKLFTLVHELTHIWLGHNGISNEDSFAPTRSNIPVERLCNAVAAELLVPAQLLRDLWPATTDGCLLNEIDGIAKKFSVSGQVIARRLLDLGLVSGDDYSQAMSIYRVRAKNAKSKSNSTGGGPSADVLFRYRIGAKTLATFSRAVDNGLISILDAARTLAIPAGRFVRVVE